MLNSKMTIFAAVLAAIALPGAAAAASPDLHAGENCTVDGVAVDPRFCVDYVGPPLWVDPVATGGVEDRASESTYIVAPNAGHLLVWMTRPSQE